MSPHPKETARSRGWPAAALGISCKTVANVTSLLKQKLGAKNHSDLVRIAVEMELG